MIHAERLMIMRLMALQYHQPHDHELECLPARGKAGPMSATGPQSVAAQGKAGR
jgi:hypothetical protein